MYKKNRDARVRTGSNFRIYVPATWQTSKKTLARDKLVLYRNVPRYVLD
jgi:hypothetical protein